MSRAHVLLPRPRTTQIAQLLQNYARAKQALGTVPWLQRDTMLYSIQEKQSVSQVHGFLRHSAIHQFLSTPKSQRPHLTYKDDNKTPPPPELLGRLHEIIGHNAWPI